MMQALSITLDKKVGNPARPFKSVNRPSLCSERSDVEHPALGFLLLKH